jgi:GNAT superfamily N-acetyltransferase
MASNGTSQEPITLRTDLRPGDIGNIIYWHGVLYAREYGFDHTFEAYVAGPLADFVLHGSERQRLWLAERQDRLVGCIAIVAATAEAAQLRWFLVDPTVRGQGLGTRLLREAIGFCQACGFRSVLLWTVSSLESAARLYRAAGFRKVEETPGRGWGVDVIEEQYTLSLM